MPRCGELVAVRLRIVAAVALDRARFAAPAGPGARAAAACASTSGSNCGDVVPIGRGQRRDERNPVRVGENMMFRPGFAAIGRVRSSFFPPRTARSEALSTTARARSSWPRCRNSSSSTAMQPLPDAGPLPAHEAPPTRRAGPAAQFLRGNMFQGMPLRRTNRDAGQHRAVRDRLAAGISPVARRAVSAAAVRFGPISRRRSSGLGRPDRLRCRSGERTKLLDQSTRGQSANFATCSKAVGAHRGREWRPGGAPVPLASSRSQPVLNPRNPRNLRII